jgi:hypothetical protein
MYNDPNCKPWTSGSWAPAGYSSRRDYYIQKKTVATGVAITSGSLSSFENENEKNKENDEKGNHLGVKVTVSGVNRSASILGNEGSATSSHVEIVAAPGVSHGMDV